MARLIVTQNNYGMWTWALIGRESGMQDMGSPVSFASREAALEAGEQVCGDEVSHTVVDGETPRTQLVAAPLPKVDPVAERAAAGVPEPDALMS